MAISLVLAAVLVEQTGSTWGRYGRLVAVATLALALTFWFDTRRAAARARPTVLWTYAGLRWLLTAVLVVGNPFFGFYAFVGYVDAVRLFPYRRAVVVIGAPALLTTTSQSGGVPTNLTVAVGFALLWAFNTALVCALGYGGVVVERQNEQRRSALAELTVAHQRLRRAQEENGGLHAQLVQQAREAGVLDERARLAREIHDTIAQGLTAVITQLQAAQTHDGGPDGNGAHHAGVAWQPRVETAITVARESLDAARRSVQALRPVELERGDLLAALRHVAQRWGALVPAAAVRVVATGPAVTLPEDVEAALLRTAQEALANAGRHAEATTVTVTVATSQDAVRLEVRDDGRGFDARAPRSDGGVGLEVMHQRLELVGGHLDVDSAPGLGTTVRAEVPLPPRSPVPAHPARAAARS